MKHPMDKELELIWTRGAAEAPEVAQTRRVETVARAREELNRLVAQLPPIGTEGFYVEAGFQLSCVVTGYVEGWVEAVMSDGAISVFRPSRFKANSELVLNICAYQACRDQFRFRAPGGCAAISCGWE